jgi:hypothetical protein
LEGLTPINQAEYGRGKHVRIASSRASATVSEIVEGAFMVEDNESLEPGGVEVDINEAEWFHEAMELAMIASEDEPSMEEALKGDERLSWSDAIKAELFQIEKLRTWDLVVPPPGANIIPSRYVFC